MDINVKIIIFTLFLLMSMPTITYSQPILDTTTIVKDSTDKANKIDRVEIAEKHKEAIKEVVAMTRIGEVIWAYFGEVIIAALGLIIFFIRDYIKTTINNLYIRLSTKNSIKYTNKDLENLGLLNIDIDTYLTKIKDITKSKRVLLYQFSNGQHFFSNIPVLCIKVTNNSLGDVPTLHSNHFNYDTAKDIVHEILNNECVKCTEKETTKYQGYISYLRFSKFKSSHLIRLNVSDNYAGIIEIIEPIEEYDSAEVKSYALSIGHLFDRYNSNKQT